MNNVIHYWFNMSDDEAKKRLYKEMNSKKKLLSEIQISYITILNKLKKIKMAKIFNFHVILIFMIIYLTIGGSLTEARSVGSWKNLDSSSISSSSDSSSSSSDSSSSSSDSSLSSSGSSSSSSGSSSSSSGSSSSSSDSSSDSSYFPSYDLKF